MFETSTSRIKLFHDFGAETVCTLPSVAVSRSRSLREHLCKFSARETEMRGRHTHVEPLCSRCQPMKCQKVPNT